MLTIIVMNPVSENMKMKIITILAALFLLASLAGASDYASKTAETESQKNIVETAVAAGNFNTLVEAVKAAGLVDTLSSPGPFTVFAPTDEAFAKVPKAVLDALMANKTLLTAVLTYHVVPGEAMSSDLKNGMSVKTVEGSDVKITIDSAGVMVNNAKVIKADIKASNGVVHVIDAVILPPVAAKAAVAIGTAAAVAGKAEETTKKAEETAKQAEATTQKSTPGFEGIIAIAGLLSVAFVAYRRRD
jgi:PGF-CTERM protein